MPEERLPPLGRGALLTAGRFAAEHDGATWIVDLDYFDLGERLRLYRDDVLVEERRSPAVFDVGGATVEASMGLLGMKHVRLRADGAVRDLTPVAGTGEAARAAFAERHPTADRVIGVAAWVVLAVALVLEVPQLLGGLGGLVGIDWSFGVVLPGPVQVVVSVLGLGAALDRALRLRYNPLLDG